MISDSLRVAASAAPPSFPRSAEVRAYLSILVDLTKALLWPLAAGLVLLKFRGVMEGAINRSKEINVKIAGAEVRLSVGEASATLNELFTEIDNAIEHLLKPDEKQLFLRILAHRYPPAVRDVIPGFARQEKELKQLRALRGVYFIRPVEGSNWQANKHIEVTTLGRIVANHRREALLTGTVPSVDSAQGREHVSKSAT